MKLYDENECQKIQQIYNQIIFLLREQREIITKLTNNEIFITDLKELIKEQLLDIGNQFSHLDQSKYKKVTQKCDIKLQKLDNHIHIIYNQEYLIFIMRKFDKYQQHFYVQNMYQEKLNKLIKIQKIDFKYQHRLDEKDKGFIQFLLKLQDNLLSDEIEQLAYLIDIKDEQLTADQFALMVDNIQQEREIQMNQLEREILKKLFEEDKIEIVISNQKFELMDPNIKKFIIDSKQLKNMKKYSIEKKVHEKVQEKQLEKRVVLKDLKYERTVINTSQNQEKRFFIAINYQTSKKQNLKSLLQQSKQTRFKEFIIHPKLIQDQPSSVIYQLTKEMYRNNNTMLYDIEGFHSLLEGYYYRKAEKLKKYLALKQNWIGEVKYPEGYFINMSYYQESLQQEQLYFNFENKIQNYQDGVYIDKNQNAVIVKQNTQSYYLGNTGCKYFKFIQQNIPDMSKDVFRFFIYVILTKTEDYKVLYRFLNGDQQTIEELIQIAEQDR